MNTLEAPNGKKPAATKSIFFDIGLDGNGFMMPEVPKGSDRNVGGPLAEI
jgi:hypothetical protein